MSTKMTAPPYTLTNESITVVWNGSPHTVQKGSPNFLALRQAILDENWGEIQNHLTVKKSLQEWAKEKFTIVDNTVLYEGEPLPEALNNRILSMAANNEDPRMLFRFWERLKKNPSFRSVTQLWNFMSIAGIPITEDGCILAYKAVRSDYKDMYSGEFDNSPGRINKMPRNKISDDPKLPCHEGFHVGALSYAENFGSGSRKLVICKIDPENVVCIPYDSDFRKMRVCEYEVIGHHGVQLPSTTFVEDKYDRHEEKNLEDSLFDESEDENEDENEDESFPEDDEDDGDDTDDEETEEIEETEAVKPEKSNSKIAIKVTKEFSKIHSMNHVELLERSLDELRKYATHCLKIVGASKIPGGKVALIHHIIKVRDDEEV